jgi:gluconolactonase
MAIDSDDRVYVTTAAGVQVFDPKGQFLGVIKADRQAANVAFAGPENRTLYLTAREGLYRVKTLAKGPSRLGTSSMMQAAPRRRKSARPSAN